MDPVTSILVQYGAVGAIALIALLVAKTLFARISEAYDREKERGDRLESELRALNEAVRNEYIGTINKSSLAINEAARAVADALSAVRRG